MLKTLLTFSLVLISFLGFSQNINLQLHFQDVMTQSAVDSVQVTISNTKKKILISKIIVKNEQITVPSFHFSKIHIQAHKNSYFSLDTLIDLDKYRRQIKKNQVIALQFNLEYNGQFSDGVDISGNYTPPVVYSSKQLEVSDYAIVDDKTTVLLVYSKRLNAGSQLIWYAHDSVVNIKKCPETAKELITDYRNRIYLRCKKNDYLLREQEKLTFVKVDRDEFNKSIRPVEDTLVNSALFFNTYSAYYPAFDYYKINLKDTTDMLLHHIEDTVMMEQYRAEYKWADPQVKLWAWDKESETGIDREVWIGANYFTHSVYYEPPYGDFFIVSDTAYVFDFYKNKMYVYDAISGNQLKQIKIDFFLNTRKTWWETGWEKTMLQDPITRKIYTYYDLGGYVELYQIDLKTGEKENKFTLFHRYPENIQVYNNHVYYMFRPFESIQKKYLYKEGFNDPQRNLKGQTRFSKGR